MMRRGQTATEYLIILAVVIVIALIVVGVIGGIPGVGSSGQSKASAAYWSTLDPIAISSFSNSATDGMTIVLRNNGKNAYTVNDVLLSDDGGSTYGYANRTDMPLSIGAESKYESDTTYLATVTEADVLCNTQGETYTYDVKINYTDSSTGANYMFAGTQKLEGACAT